MNKQELIERLENKMCGNSSISYEVGFESMKKIAIELAKQLGEPQKVVIPQFVAEIIENAGGTRNDHAKEYVIRSVIDDYYKGNWEPFVQEWFDQYCNIIKFYRAVENGYEEESE